MCTSHLELFYREFYNDGAAWGLKISGKGPTVRYWCEEYWSCYHMTHAGLSDLPQKGAWLRPILDGNSVMALGHADFTALMTNEKSFHRNALEGDIYYRCDWSSQRVPLGYGCWHFCKRRTDTKLSYPR